MIPKPELLFYNPRKFKDIKAYYHSMGRDVVSFSVFVINEDNYGDYDGEKTVVDISIIASLKDFQYQMERLLDRFDEDYIFISDIKFKEAFELTLRFCFEQFVEMEEFLIDPLDDVGHPTTKSKSPHKKITDLSKLELDEFYDLFNRNLYGHKKFKANFKELVDNFRIFNRLGEHKILSLFLMGDSGVGKTEVARAIHKSLGGERKMAKVNFGNYSSDNSLNSLIGSPRGYIGSENGEIFIRVNDSDTGVILIDEFEKSNSMLFNYFLDVLENGKMVSSIADEIDLNGFIIIFTSNILKDDFKKVISPELRSRFDYKGFFSILKDEDKLKYVEFRVNNIIKKFNINIANVLDDDFRKLIISEITVSRFENMRDLNKHINKVFVRKTIDRVK